MKFTSSPHARIRELEEQLYLARRTVIKLTGETTSQVLSPPYNLKSWQEAYDWFEKVIEQVIHEAPIIPKDRRTDYESLGERAICPLCGDSAQDYYNPTNGFAHPEGLRRHLVGSHKSTQCEVAREALQQARYFADKQSTV
ncbi:hypothetical protein [Dyella mobilis]|uniref:Uncharacterized protein n=1 Tax=Dyella mobilis TaxID=1849582 RepID=A0ABS2KDX8_9GAMM|nr:hypothetical protein [Dyella mobilis]MBM7129386.1 hypothetical protein [Dyella mobilis]GLQ98349.1 hypothetical protein GCM10007863_27690 [Dyella mobilis]